MPGSSSRDETYHSRPNRQLEDDTRRAWTTAQARRPHCRQSEARSDTCGFSTTFRSVALTNLWTDTAVGQLRRNKIYVVQTNAKVVERCLLMTTDPGDLVFDPTCGSGTTAYVAEQWGRRWITCDTSRVAVTLAKQRLMTASFDYYELAHPGGGRRQRVRVQDRAARHAQEHRQQRADRGRRRSTTSPKRRIGQHEVRVTGPFTVEAVPAPDGAARSTDDGRAAAGGRLGGPLGRDAAPGRVAGRAAQDRHPRQERPDDPVQPRRAAGRHPLAPRGCRDVPNERGADRVSEPRQGPRGRAGRDLLRPGARAARAAAGRAGLGGGAHAGPAARHPRLRRLPVRPRGRQGHRRADAREDGDDLPQGPDERGPAHRGPQEEARQQRVASGSSVSPTSRCAPSARASTRASCRSRSTASTTTTPRPARSSRATRGASRCGCSTPTTTAAASSRARSSSRWPDEADGWARLARNLKAEIDLERIEAYRGTVSLPFEGGEHKRVAVKIVDDRGIESLKIIPVS